MTASSSIIQVWCLCFPLVFFSFPLLHTGSVTIELDSVCQAVSIVKKSLGDFGRYGGVLCFKIRVLVQSRPFSFQSQYSDHRWKSQLCFRPHPAAVDYLQTWKVWRQCQLITYINQTKEKSSSDPACPPLIPLTSSWQRVRQGAEKKNKLQLWSGYLINHDNVVLLNEHFFPDLILPTILWSLSQLLRETRHIRQLATKMIGTLAKAL